MKIQSQLQSFRPFAKFAKAINEKLIKFLNSDPASAKI